MVRDKNYDDINNNNDDGNSTQYKNEKKGSYLYK